MRRTDAAQGGARTKVNDRIVRAIQAQIQKGELTAGDQLPSERRLASLFRASRASVREALRTLERSGVVHARHGEGNFVTAGPPETASTPLAQFLARERERLIDLSAARQMLEPRLAFLAAQRATVEDLAHLRAILDEEPRNLESPDVESAFNADRSFHVTIAEATHSQTFIMLHNFLSDLVSGSRREAIYHESRRAPSRDRDHRAIYDAIARGDAGGASAAMLRHLKNVEALLVEALMAYQGAVDSLRAPAGRSEADSRGAAEPALAALDRGAEGD